MAQICFGVPRRKEKRMMFFDVSRLRFKDYYLIYCLVEKEFSREFCDYTKNISLIRITEAHPGKMAFLIWLVLPKLPGIW